MLSFHVRKILQFHYIPCQQNCTINGSTGCEVEKWTQFWFMLFVCLDFNYQLFNVSTYVTTLIYIKNLSKYNKQPYAYYVYLLDFVGMHH